MKNDYYSGTYIPGIVKWGKITLLLGIFAGFLPALVMAFRGYMPPVSAIIAGTLMQISVSGAFYIVEPISYFPILGIPGTYLTFLSGNTSNMRVPCSSVAQEAAGVGPAAPCGIIREMPIEISGESSTQKRARVVEQLAQHQADVLAITLPDNIAWLLNVRGSDLAMVPVPFSFALLHRSGELEWFVDSNKTQQLPASLLNTLTLAPQESFLARCQQLAKGKRFLVDRDYAPVALRFAIEEHGGNVLWACQTSTAC